MPDNEMASWSPFQSTSYHYGVQGCTGGCHVCPQGQYRSIRAEEFPVPTYRVRPPETASQQLSLPSNYTSAGIAIRENGFNTRCMRNHESPNGCFNFSAGSDPLLPPTMPPFVRDDQKQKCNSDFAWMPLHVAGTDFSEMFNTQIQSVPDETLHSGLYGFLGIDDVGTWNQGSRTHADDALFLNHAVSWPVPFDGAHSFTDRIHFLDQSMLEIPPLINEPLMPLGTGMQDQVLHTTAQMNVPLYDLHSSLQIGDSLNESPQKEMEDIPLPSSPSNGPFDHTFQHSNSPTTSKSDLSISSGIVEPAKSLELRILMPKPPNLPAGAATAVDSDKATEETPSKPGRRGPLTGAGAKAAARMRQIGSCSRCIIRKQKCTEGSICKPCQMPDSQYTLQTAPNCHRGKLGQYIDSFFPRIIFANLDQQEMKIFVSKVEFTNAETRVRLFLGLSYPSVPLVVTAFRTTDEKFSHVPDLSSTLNDDKQSFATTATSDFGVQPSTADQLEQTCVDYLKILDNDQKFRIGSSKITNRVLDAARRFQQTSINKDILLRKAITIAIIYHLIGKRFFFSRESSSGGSESSATLSSESSRVLNRQIKSTLFHMLKNLVPEVLKILDGRLRNQEKETWAASLLTHLLLCSCVELIQVAIDASLVGKKPIEGMGDVYTRQHARNISHGLEQITLEHTWSLVDGILKGLTKRGNAFKIGLQTDDQSGMNEAEINLVADIRQIAMDYKEEIDTRAENSYYGGLSHMISDYKKFKVQNSSRIVCKAIQRLCG